MIRGRLARVGNQSSDPAASGCVYPIDESSMACPLPSGTGLYFGPWGADTGSIIDPPACMAKRAPKFVTHHFSKTVTGSVGGRGLGGLDYRRGSPASFCFCISSASRLIIFCRSDSSVTRSSRRRKRSTFWHRMNRSMLAPSIEPQSPVYMLPLPEMVV